MNKFEKFSLLNFDMDINFSDVTTYVCLINIHLTKYNSLIWHVH